VLTHVPPNWLRSTSATCFPDAAKRAASDGAVDSKMEGMVSRDEFMSYMGKQYDRMDAGKKGMLSKPQFMDTKMMRSTFPASGD